MADIRRYEFCINDILQGGETCENPDITYESLSDCVTVPCIEDGCIEVEVLDGCEDPCILFRIDCDDCDTCPPKTFERCFCNTVDDCPDCHACTDGVCEPLCEDDEICDNGNCVECTSDADCDCNEVCDNGTCRCPVDKPYRNDAGCCRDCQTDADCPDCYICTQNGCEPVNCPTGVCDPDTNECVECNTSTDCTGANECCDDGQCVCCAGYIRDPDTGDCIEKPDCDEDEDCPTCHICVNGSCEPLNCPGTKQCIDDDCLDTCDCADPDCSNNEVCVEKSDGNCYCEQCDGTCNENDDCGPGCYCDNGECRKNPCFDYCASGQDCGQGCGCIDGECYPCDSFGCDPNDCQYVSGCECDEFDSCSPTPCSGPCANSDDCGSGCGCVDNECVSCSEFDCLDGECDQIEGCECVNGRCTAPPCEAPCSDAEDCGTGCGCEDNECVSCESRTCTDNQDCPQGCYCDSGNCRPNPCEEIFCANSEDCGLGCECVDGECYPSDDPDGGGDGDGGCDDTLTIERIDEDCDLKGVLQTEDCCGCDDIGIGFDVDDATVSGDDLDLTIGLELRKGGFASYQGFINNPLLSNTGVVNELPDFGKVKIWVKETYVRQSTPGDPDGPQTSGAPSTYTNTASKEVTFTNEDTEDVTFDGLTDPGSLVANYGTMYRLTKTVVEARIINDFAFPNGCVYEYEKRFTVFNTDDSFGNDDVYALRFGRKTNCRDPLLTWYRSSTASGLTDEVNVFRQVYGYEDIIETYAEGLEPFKYYAISSECGCDNATVYSCEAGGGADKLAFCDPTDFSYDLENCGKRFKLTEDIVIDCDVYLDSPQKPQYELILNGTVVDTFTLPSGTDTLLTSGYTVNHGEVIDTVELNLVQDTCQDCDIVKATEVAKLTANVQIEGDPCSEQSSDITLRITASGGNSPYTYEIFLNGSSIQGPTQMSGTYTEVDVAPNNGTYQVEIVDDDNCTATDTASFEFIDNSVAEWLSISSSCTEGVGTITFHNDGTKDAEGFIPGVGGSTYTVPAGQDKSVDVNASYTGTVELYPKGNSDCKITKSVSLECCGGFGDVSITSECTSGSNLEITVQNSSAEPIDAEVINEDTSLSAAGPETISQTSHTFTGLDPDVNYRVEVTPTEGTGCETRNMFTHEAGDCCDTFKSNIQITGDCQNGNGIITVSNSKNYDIKITVTDNSGTNVVHDGTGGWTGNVSDGQVTVKVEDNNSDCEKTLTDTIDCCTGCDYAIPYGDRSAGDVYALYGSDGTLIYQGTGAGGTTSDLENTLETKINDVSECGNTSVTVTGGFIFVNTDVALGSVEDYPFQGGQLLTYWGNACSCQGNICDYNTTVFERYVYKLKIGVQTIDYTGNPLDIFSNSGRTQLEQDIAAAIQNSPANNCDQDYGQESSTSVNVSLTGESEVLIEINNTSTAVGVIHVSRANDGSSIVAYEFGNSCAGSGGGSTGGGSLNEGDSDGTKDTGGDTESSGFFETS